MHRGNLDTASIKYECSCRICPNVQNFCQNNGQFSSVGDATASPCRTLMDMIMEGLSYMIENSNVDSAGICVRSMLLIVYLSESFLV